MDQYLSFTVDAVENLVLGKCIVGYKMISNNENYFNGHPGNVPGTFQFNIMLQLLNRVLLNKIANQHRKIYVVRNKMRLYRELVPGDCFRVKLMVDSVDNDIYIVSGHGYVEENLVCQSNLSVKILSSGDDNA
jgi:3-hydroxymyristoyl/3-hydroxydecanoyl-(acyl carrier protein) dehydratase